VLKNRWQCLKERLRVKEPLFASNVIKSCAALHNFLIDCKEEFDDLDSDIELEENSDDEENGEPPAFNG